MLVRWIIAAGLAGARLAGQGDARSDRPVLGAAISVGAITLATDAPAATSRVVGSPTRQVEFSWRVRLSGGCHTAGEVWNDGTSELCAQRLAWRIVMLEMLVAAAPLQPMAVLSHLWRPWSYGRAPRWSREEA